MAARGTHIVGEVERNSCGPFDVSSSYGCHVIRVRSAWRWLVFEFIEIVSNLEAFLLLLKYVIDGEA